MRAAWAAIVCAGLIATGCGAVHLNQAASVSPSPSYVPWLPLTATNVFPEAPGASPAPPEPIPAGTSECTSRELAMAASFLGGGAGGHTDMPVEFRDVGPTTCYLQGYPDVTILSAAGKVLAEGSGAAGRGTFFDPQWVEPILLHPGTQFASPGQTPPLGQARLNIEWWDCDLPTAATIRISLPDAGGVMTAPFAVKAGYSPTCDGGPGPRSGAYRGQFLPTGLEWPPAAKTLSIGISIKAPSSAKRGSSLTYYVTLTNLDVQAYVLDPCPDYIEILGPKLVVAEYQLNCASVMRILPGAAVTFQMRLALPTTTPVGNNIAIRWALVDGRVAPESESAPITVD